MTVKFWHSSFWWIKGRHDKLGSFLYCCILSINSIWSWQVSTIWITKRGTIKTLFYLRWLLLGGYSNVEGGSHTRPLDTVDLLTLDQEGEFMTHDVSCDTWHVTRDTWHVTCQVSLLTRAPGAPLPGLHCPGRWTQPQWPGSTPGTTFPQDLVCISLILAVMMSRLHVFQAAHRFPQPTTPQPWPGPWCAAAETPSTMWPGAQSEWGERERDPGYLQRLLVASPSHWPVVVRPPDADGALWGGGCQPPWPQQWRSAPWRPGLDDGRQGGIKHTHEERGPPIPGHILQHWG